MAASRNGFTRATDPAKDAAQWALDAAGYLASGDARHAIEALQCAQKSAQLSERRLVETLRQRGQSWQQIGDALGVTRSAAHQRFGP